MLGGGRAHEVISPSSLSVHLARLWLPALVQFRVQSSEQSWGSVMVLTDGQPGEDTRNLEAVQESDEMAGNWSSVARVKGMGLAPTGQGQGECEDWRKNHF